MTEFLPGDAIVTTIKNDLSNAKQADFAVAYWGKGAMKRLGLQNIQIPVRILCDLRSLNCNPDELKNFLRPPFELRTKDGLHAKVYLMTNKVIVGSANASINGLGDEGNESDLELEAAVACMNEKVVLSAKKWFQKHWDQSETVDKSFLEAIKQARDWKSKMRLLPLLARAPELFRGMPIRFAIFHGYNEAVDTEVAKKLYGEKAKQYEDSHPFYVDHSSSWSIKPGQYVLNFWTAKPKIGSWKFSRDGRFYQGGLWCVRRLERIKLKNGKTVTVVDASPDIKRSVLGYKFSSEDHKTLGSCAEEYFKRKGEVKNHVLKGMLEMSLSELPKEILDHLKRRLRAS